MSTVTEAVTAELAAITTSELRQAFPAHRQLSETQLVYTADGIGHVRDLTASSGSVLVCGRSTWPADDGPQERWSFMLERGLEILPRLGCDVCAQQLADLREAAIEEREGLRIAIAHARSIEGVLTSLQAASRS